ncbi:response regulator [Desulfobacula toluolica]|uniref:Response regulator receiver protein, related to CheY n=1 Tax=Desulfobacula toluolica (strain DSM 7467 / Tol2) TaxID=651182 RepID=K0NN04_DESTT|nr:response regulator [Desulfobacula toluolica]CCK81398.1 response regulator receiver protein, related to CheY [Desulfobacula toluolica Tol2]
MAKILLIDDSWLTRRGLSGMISSSGHEIVEAENGMDGIKKIQDECPDCIFLDLLMPEMDGYEVLEILKEKNIKIPVIVCSADIQNTAKSKCLKLGAFDFLNKPPMVEEVLQVLEKALQI